MTGAKLHLILIQNPYMQMLVLSVNVDSGSFCTLGNTLISPFPAISMQNLFPKNRPSFAGICMNLQFRRCLVGFHFHTSIQASFSAPPLEIWKESYFFQTLASAFSSSLLALHARSPYVLASPPDHQ